VYASRVAGRRVSIYLSDEQQLLLEVHGLRLRDVVRRVIDLELDELKADRELKARCAELRARAAELEEQRRAELRARAAELRAQRQAGQMGPTA
jgi:hypothetical protein